MFDPPVRSHDRAVAGGAGGQHTPATSRAAPDERVTAMQRVQLRRFVMVAVFAVVGSVALAGCQSAPGAAAYVGDQTLTDAQVESTVDAVLADYKIDRYMDGVSLDRLRQLIVQDWIGQQLAQRYAADHGISLPAPDYDEAGLNLHLPSTNPYTRLDAQATTDQQAIEAKAGQVQPTDADLRDIYNRAVAAEPDLPSFADSRQAIAALPNLSSALGLRKALTDAANQYGVTVSPRYQPLELALIQLPVGSDTVAVVTVPVGQSTQTPAVRNVP